MSALSSTYEASLRARYAEARSRLLGKQPVVRLGVPKPALCSPQAEVPSDPKPVVELPPVEVLEAWRARPFIRAPLDMLRPCSWRFLLRLAAIRNGTPEKHILSASRERSICAARQDAMGLMYQHTQMSMPAVGKMFGRHHTTVLHALSKASKATKLVELRPATEAAARPKNEARPQKPKSVRKPTYLQRAVLRAYRNNVPPSVVAEEYGCNPRSVAVIAHNMGIKRSDFSGKHKTAWVASAPAAEAMGK